MKESVILGCVRKNGWVWPTVTVIDEALVTFGSDNATKKGKAGMRISNDSGNGFMSSALAFIDIEWFTEKIWKDFKVTKSVNSGKGMSLPGVGRPGKSGTKGCIRTESSLFIMFRVTYS